MNFDKGSRQITFECRPRFSDAKAGEQAQFPGWPITVKMDDNDGRKPAGYLPTLVFKGAANPVVQVIENTTGEIRYTVRVQGDRFQPRVYAPGQYTVKVRREKPDGPMLTGLQAADAASAGGREMKL